MSVIKLPLRSLLVSYLSIYMAQILVGGFFFGLDGVKTFVFVLVAVTILNMLIVPILKIIKLPHKGIMLIFLSFILTSLTFYILPMFIEGFHMIETDLARLRIFGFVLPSRHLGALESTVASGIVFALTYHFIEWLYDKR